MEPIDWDKKYQAGEAFWDRGQPSLPLKQYLERNPITGPALVPGCGRGHEVALATQHGLEAIGLDISPTAIAEAQGLYPDLKERFLVGNLFDPPQEMHHRFDFVIEHTCMSGLPPNLRSRYRHGIDLILRPGGLLIGVWFINPARAIGHEGPPYTFSVESLSELFAVGYEIIEDYIPEVAFEGREGRERVRVLKRISP